MAEATATANRGKVETVLKLVDAMKRLHRAWQASEEISLSNEFWISLENVIIELSKLPVVPELGAVYRAADRFVEAFDRVTLHPETGGRVAGQVFWQFYEELLKAAESIRNPPPPPEPPRVETVAELHRQGVSYNQIMKMWRLPNTAAVAAEIDKPGTWVKPGHKPRELLEWEERHAAEADGSAFDLRRIVAFAITVENRRRSEERQEQRRREMEMAGLT